MTHIFLFLQHQEEAQDLVPLLVSVRRKFLKFQNYSSLPPPHNQIYRLLEIPIVRGFPRGSTEFLSYFYTPVFRRDVLWYGDVRPSVRPGLRPSIRPSVRPSQFSTLFSYMLWHIFLKFCVLLYFYARKIKFECHQFPSLFAGVMLLFNFKLLQICSFPHFSPTCFDILSSNFVYDFVLMYHRASLSVVILQQFLLELCLFVNLEYSKYSVFRTFLLHALTYWAEILHMTLFYCTTDQVWVSLICVNFCGSYAPFWNLEYWKYTVFRTFLLHPLTYWAESLHITLFFCTTDQVWVSSICVYFGVMPLFELRIL